MRLELVDLTDVVDRARPRLERDVVEDPLRQGRHAGTPTADRLAGHRAHDRLAIGPARRRQRRRSCRTAAPTAAATAAAASLTAACWCLGTRSTTGWRLSSRRITACWCLGTDRKSVV